jgi:hypothetical protein
MEAGGPEYNTPLQVHGRSPDGYTLTSRSDRYAYFTIQSNTA